MVSGFVAYCMRQAGTAPPEWDVPYEDAPKQEPSDPTKKYVALRNKHTLARFFSTNGPFRSDWYEEIGCFDSVEDAQRACGIG